MILTVFDTERHGCLEEVHGNARNSKKSKISFCNPLKIKSL